MGDVTDNVMDGVETSDGLDEFDELDPFAEDDDEDFWGADEDDAKAEAKTDDASDAQTDAGAEQQAEQPAQTPEVNALLAAARRRAEVEAAQKAQLEKDAIVARAYGGQVNPYTGMPITTEAELKAYQAAYQQEQQQQAMAQAGLSPELLNQMIEQTPAVQQAKAVVAQQQQVLGQQLLSEQIKAISALDPSVQSLADISKMETFGQFDTMVKQGYSLVDAYKLANFDALAAKRAGAARQRAINQTAGKAHLKSTQGKESGQAVVVPPDVRAMYREMNPGISDKEIAKHYAKTLKE